MKYPRSFQEYPAPLLPSSQSSSLPDALSLSPPFPLPPFYRFQDLEDCSDDVGLRHQLWASRMAWDELTEGLLNSQFEQVDVAAMEEAVTRFNKAVFKMERGLVPNKVRVVCSEMGGGQVGSFIPSHQPSTNCPNQLQACALTPISLSTTLRSCPNCARASTFGATLSP